MERMLKNEKIADFDNKVNSILASQSCSNKAYCNIFTEQDKLN